MEDKLMSTQEKMNSYKKNATIIGILFIIATAFLFVGDSFYGPVLDTPDYLQVAYPNRISAVIGMLIEFSCILAIPLIPVFAYPVLRKHSEILALGYIVFRLFEAVLFVLVDITKLALIKVSQLYLAAESWRYNPGLERMGLGILCAHLRLWRADLLFRTVSIKTATALDFHLGADCHCNDDD